MKIFLTDEIIQKFANYYLKPENGAWGSLHIVLDDDNVRDSDVEFCIQRAKDKNDLEGEELGKILLQLSKTQRLRLSGAVQQFIDMTGKKK